MAPAKTSVMLIDGLRQQCRNRSPVINICSPFINQSINIIKYRNNKKYERCKVLMCSLTRRLLYPSVCLSVCLCHLLNVPTHHCADVPFNWRQVGTATAGSQQQACCVSLYVVREGRCRVGRRSSAHHCSCNTFDSINVVTLR